MPDTPIYQIPYQGLNDAPDGAGLGQGIAEAVEAELARIDSDVAAVAADRSRPTAKLCNTNAQSIPNNDITVMTMNTTLWATDGVTADLSNNRIVISTPGIYLVSVSVRWSPGSGERIAVIARVNGNNMGGQAMTSVSGTNAYTLNVPLLLGQGDLVTGCAFQTTGGSVNTAPAWDTPYLAVSWISEPPS